MTSLQIRDMTDADLGRVRELSGQLGYPIDAEALRDNVRRVQGLSDHGLFVAVDPDAGIAGWTHVHMVHTVDSGSWAEIGSLVVDAAVRRKGIGRALLREVERWAAGKGLKRLRVRSNVRRTESHQFYPAAGFSPLKTQHVYERAVP